MARYIDAELLMQKLSRMIDYCEKNKDKKFNALNVLFQVGDAIMDCPTADVVPKSEVEELKGELAIAERHEKDARALFKDAVIQLQNARREVAREIFAEIDEILKTVTKVSVKGQEIDCGAFGYYDLEKYSELKKKYTEGRNEHEYTL